MNVLILEDDELVAGLLESVIASLYAGVGISIASTVANAKEHWRENAFQLAIVDWNLPDGSGLDLIETIREHDTTVPVFLVTARADRESVLKAAHLGITAFITKPFSAEMLQARIRALIPPEQAPRETIPDLAHVLGQAMESIVQLPTGIDTAGILALISRNNEISASQLAELWQNDASICARLLDIANSSSFHRTGVPVGSVKAAISLMGTKMALNQALAMSLDIAGALKDSRLSAQASGFRDTAVAVANEARRLSLKLGLDAPRAHTAGLLSRIGELAVLKVLQQFIDQGSALNDDQITDSLRNSAQGYGNRLKVRWKLPSEIRVLIGAVHLLPPGTTGQAQIVMRAAALRVNGEATGVGDTAECLKLMRRVGLDVNDGE